MPIQSLGYLHLQTPNLDAWSPFATEVLGFMPTDGPDGASRYFRWDDRPYRLILSPAEQAGVTAIGYEVGDDRDLRAAIAALEAAGIDVRSGSKTEAAARRVSGFASFADPAGAPIELFYGPVLTHEPVATPLVSRFVTGEMGLGHVVTDVPDLEQAVDFYRDVFGFHCRNTWYFADMAMAFLGCNPRHHTLAFASGMPGRGLIRHFMVEAATIDDVGLAQDRCVDHGVPVIMALGRHTNDRMISFYCQTPDGFLVEFGWGGVAVPDPASTGTYQITKPSFWGHRRLAT